MELVEIGYFPKKIEKPPDWLAAAHVESICSVSNCISAGPEDWIGHWKHNHFGLFNSVAAAESVIPREQRAEFHLFAYRLLPTEFSEGAEASVEVSAPPVEPLPSAFRHLGYDVVSRSTGSNFECSPLSCNSAAGEIEVNEYCLLDRLEAAVEAARAFSSGNWEPGPYYVLEVLSDLK